jgi:5'-methylthioadenosine phosphorylase
MLVLKVGSLREEIAPLDFVLPNQVIDRTKGIRAHTFFENGVAAHVEFADPFCEELADIIALQAHALSGHNGERSVQLHRHKTLVCMEGPAFSTRAESKMYRSWGCDVVNMSTLPEAKLAKEAEMSYQVICMATDYDCWREVEGEDVNVQAVILNLNKNAENAKSLVMAVLPHLADHQSKHAGKLLEGTGRGAIKQGSMKYGCITAMDQRSAEQVQKLEYLLPGYFSKE